MLLIVHILVRKELEKSPFNYYLQVYVKIDFCFYSSIVKILYKQLIHSDIEKFLFLTKRQNEIYEFLKEHIQGSLRDKD